MRNFKKSEVLEIFSKHGIKQCGFSTYDEKTFWLLVSFVTYSELMELGINIIDIQPWNEECIRIAIENVIDE